MNKQVTSLIKLAGWIFVVYGIIIAIKGAIDIFYPNPATQFVPVSVYTGKWVPFEMAYGAACVVTGLACFKYTEKNGDT